MWASKNTANKLPNKRKHSDNPLLAELALHTALDATPPSISLPVAAEFLRANGVIVIGETPSSLTISYGNDIVPLRIAEVKGNNVSLVSNDNAHPAYDVKAKDILVGFAEGMKLNLKLVDHFCAACGNGILSYNKEIGKYFDHMDNEVDITDTGSENYPYYGIVLEAEEIWNGCIVQVHISVDLTEDEKKIRDFYDADDDELIEDWIAEEPLRGRLGTVTVDVRTI